MKIKKIRKGFISIVLVFCLLLSAVLVFGLVGCKPKGNDIFTDEFFEGVVQMDCVYLGLVREEQMKPVITYLKEVRLVRSDEEPLTNIDENGDLTMGLCPLFFCKSDGSEIGLFFNGRILNSPDGSVYELADEDADTLNTALGRAFREGMAIPLDSEEQ